MGITYEQEIAAEYRENPAYHDYCGPSCVCAGCGERTLVEDLVRFDGVLLCEYCLELNDAVPCDGCGEGVLVSEACYHGSGYRRLDGSAGVLDHLYCGACAEVS